MDSKVENYFSKNLAWKNELLELRSIIVELPVEETLKWGTPTYVYKNKNVVGLAGFKNYCGLWFFQGALIDDKFNVFVNAQEGKTKAMLQWRFTSMDEIRKSKIQDYVLQALKNIDEGKEIKPKSKSGKISIPDLLKKALELDEVLQTKFHEFSNFKQREFTEYINEAKREATKESRLEKIIPLIKRGEGLNDKYRNC